MRFRPPHMLARAVLSATLVAAAVMMPAAALGAPAPTQGQIDSAKAAKDAARAELEAMQADLDRETGEYVQLAEDMTRTRAEISEVASQSLQLESRLTSAQALLDEWAVQLYRTDPLSIFDMLLSSHSVGELVIRAEALTMLSERDAAVVDEVERLRSESITQRRRLDSRLAELAGQQAAADERRERIEDKIDDQARRVRILGADVAELMRRRAAAMQAGSRPTRAFVPDTVLSETNFRDSRSLTVAEIQSFLELQPGTLRSYRARDHLGRERRVAEMVAEAAAGWGVNPKVILVTLQKEQSLLSDPSPSGTAYDWAMGCGKSDSRTYYEYQGFGNQIWWGAQKFDKNARLWYPGITKNVDGSVVRPTNPATHAQYMYTPHFHGVMSFWMLYWRYFGDPEA